MKVLIACEESQEVCKAFRAKGHEAYSCDIQMCSGGHPEWHICNDVLDIINGNTDFFTVFHTLDHLFSRCAFQTIVACSHVGQVCTRWVCDNHIPCFNSMLLAVTGEEIGIAIDNIQNIIAYMPFRVTA